MTILYNCRHDGDQYRITKFDSDMNVESTYLCDLSPSACQCPAFERRSKCRHIEMLPQFISRNHIGDAWFLDFDRGGWVQMGSEWSVTEPEPMIESEITPQMIEDAVEYIDRNPSLASVSERPKGVFIRRRI